MNDDWLQFAFKGYSPYKVIRIGDTTLMALDMESGEITSIAPRHDQYERMLVAPNIVKDGLIEAEVEEAIVTVYFDPKTYRLHRIDGPAYQKIALSQTPYNYHVTKYFLHGKEYKDKAEWFEALTNKEKKAAAFNLDELK